MFIFLIILWLLVLYNNTSVYYSMNHSKLINSQRHYNFLIDIFIFINNSLKILKNLLKNMQNVCSYMYIYIFTSWILINISANNVKHICMIELCSFFYGETHSKNTICQYMKFTALTII